MSASCHKLPLRFRQGHNVFAHRDAGGGAIHSIMNGHQEAAFRAEFALEFMHSCGRSSGRITGRRGQGLVTR
jgi:hypothetical protein